MNEHAYTLANNAAQKPSTISEVADAIGYSREALSRYLSRSYGANPAQIEAAILARYDIYPCTHNGIEISGPDCQRRATAPRPFGGRAKEAHWLACQVCQHNKSGNNK